MAQENYMRRTLAAEYLQTRYGAYTAQTLAKLACIGGGPIFRKLGRTPVYTKEGLDEWAQARLSKPVRSTSELIANAEAA